MDVKIRKMPNIKEEPDSGVDNNSDSGHSADDDLQAISSDYEELLSSDNESNPRKNDKIKGVRQERPAEFKNADTSTKKDSVKTNSEKLQSTELKNSDTSTLKDSVQTNSEQLQSTTEVNKKLIKNEYKEAANFFRSLAKSQREPVDFNEKSTTQKPDWFDEEKFKRGQKFALDNLFSINFAEMLSLIILFAQKSALTPLIFTGKSDTPYKAFKRYLSTLVKLMSWYEDDLWSEADSLGKRNLTIVREMHKNVYERLKNTPPEELVRQTTLGDPETTALWCPMKDIILEDFREALPSPTVEYEKYERRLTGRTSWVNQSDMTFVQFAFVGLAVTYPKYFGIHLASDEDLDAFLHMWRCLGYLLGIKDKYNYCNTDLENVRLRTKLYVQLIAIPALRNVTCDWEHMCRCLTAGISFYLPLVNFESSLLYICDMFRINVPRLKKEISFTHHLIFIIHKITFYLMRYECVLTWLNSRLHFVISKVRNASPEVLAEWESKQFPYMQQPGKCPIRTSC